MAGQVQALCVILLLPLCWTSLHLRSRSTVAIQVEREAEDSVASQTGGVSQEVLREQAGVCARATWEERLVVAARYDEDVSWMAAYLVPWMPFLVYSVSGDRAATHRTLSNAGREAQAYLQFLVDYYDCLPTEIAFIHAHRGSPHSPDMLDDLRRLKWGSVPGFASLSRPAQSSTFWFSEPERHLPDPGDESETAHWSRFAYEQNLKMQAAWPEVFGDDLGAVPETMTSPCCGQFVVTRERIRRHGRRFYQRCLLWLQIADVDGFWAGLVFEQTWAHIFGAGSSYVQPEECAVFACDARGEPVTPSWESLVPPRPGCTQRR